jgi:hypothetical protein
VQGVAVSAGVTLSTENTFSRFWILVGNMLSEFLNNSFKKGTGTGSEQSVPGTSPALNSVLPMSPRY